MDLIRGKRGIVFTLIALLLAGMFIILYTTDVRMPLDSRVELQTMRILGVRTLAETFEKYLSDATANTARAGFRAILLYENETGLVPNSTDELRCMLADVMMDGKIMLKNYTANTSRTTSTYLALAYSFMDSDNSFQGYTSGTGPLFLELNASGYANFTYGLLQGFSSVTGFFLQSVTLRIKSTDGSPRDAFVVLGLYTSACNKTIFPLDEVNMTVSVSGSISDVIFTFENAPQIEKGKSYFLLVQSSQNISVNAESSNASSTGNITMKQIQNVTILANYTYSFMANGTNILEMMTNMSSFTEAYLGIRSHLAILDLSIAQKSAWEVVIEGEAVIQVEDNFSSYQEKVPIYAVVDITGLPEPLYLLNKHELRPIKAAPHGVDYGFNLSTFTEYFMDYSYWERYNESPNFLYRMMNWTNSSPNYGYETVLNVSRANTSSVDWMYFSMNASPRCPDLWVINSSLNVLSSYPVVVRDYWSMDTPTGNLRVPLDTNSLLIYNISSVLWVTNCSGS